jgi:hypothetical protein
MKTRIVTCLLVSLGLLIAGCRGSEDANSSSSEAQQAAPPAQTAETPPTSTGAAEAPIVQASAIAPSKSPPTPVITDGGVPPAPDGGFQPDAGPMTDGGPGTDAGRPSIIPPPIRQTAEEPRPKATAPTGTSTGTRPTFKVAPQ